MPKLRNQSEILLFSIVAHDTTNKKIIPIGDFLSIRRDSITINCYLTKVIERFSLYSFFIRPKVVVTDYSWANLHALCSSLNDLEIIDYVNLTFKFLVRNEKVAIFPIRTMIYLMFCECLKNIKNVFARKFRDEIYVKSLAALSRDQLEFDIESLLKIEIFQKDDNLRKGKNREIFL